MSQPRKHLGDRVVVYAVIWIVCYCGTLAALTSIGVSKPVGLLLTGIAALSFAVFVYKFYRSIVFMDEVQIKIQMEAAVVGFALGLLLLMVLGLLDLVVELKRENWNYRFLLPYFIVFYFIGLAISTRKYNFKDEKHD